MACLGGRCGPRHALAALNQEWALDVVTAAGPIRFGAAEGCFTLSNFSRLQRATTPCVTHSLQIGRLAGFNRQVRAVPIGALDSSRLH
jgi:subtilisin family serine protease